MSFIVRTATKNAIEDLIAARALMLVVNVNTGTTPQISRDLDGPYQAREVVAIGDVVGESRIPTARAGAKTVEDDFEIDVHILVAIPGRTVRENETRCSELLVDVVAAVSLTANLGGVVTGLLSAVAVVGDGPNSKLMDVAGTNTHAAMVSLVVDCVSRVSPT